MKNFEQLKNQQQKSIPSQIKTLKSSSDDIDTQEETYTNQSRLNQIMNDKMMSEILLDLLKQAGKESQVFLQLKLESSSQFQYDLDVNDLKELLENFGPTKSISKQNDKSVIVEFSSASNALCAAKILNEFKIQEAQLQVKLLTQKPLPQLNYNSSSFNTDQTKVMNNQLNQQYMNNFQPQQQFYHHQKHQNQNNQTKFTSRYEVQIKNDKKFNVSQRIIGTRGVNMKKIIEVCENKFAYLNLKGGNLLKLRLRGQGSGFKEGPDRRESNEPLHLCVSSKYQNIYDVACQCIEELLTQIYQQYFDYCEKNMIAYNATITVKKLNGHGKYPKDKKNSKKLKRQGTWKRHNNNYNQTMFQQMPQLYRMNSYPQQNNWGNNYNSQYDGGNNYQQNRYVQDQFYNKNLVVNY